jgi:pyruvate dehydrogenase E2 component (dihydrolipoamide acetyltransferase)
MQVDLGRNVALTTDATDGSGLLQQDGRNGRRVIASPLARRVAQRAGIDLAALRGSGPNGRIVMADIETAQWPGASPAPVPSPAKSPPPPIAVPHTLVPHSTMRKVIARRLAEAKQSVPHFYVAADIELDALLRLRADLNARTVKMEAGASTLSVNDMLIRAAAVTLRRVPKVNVAWSDEGVIVYDDVDISVAVSVPDGVIAPIVRRADQKGIAAISREMQDLATRARAGKLRPEEFQGGSFTLSNLGMYGVAEFAAIINPPQAAILAVAAGQQRPVVKQGSVVVATVMRCMLSVDHRVVDGALAAAWLTEFRSLVEDPLSLLL